MHQIKTILGDGFQIVIPPEYLQILGLEVGDAVILRLEDSEVRIFTPQQAIRKAQELVSKYLARAIQVVVWHFVDAAICFSL